MPPVTQFRSNSMVPANQQPAEHFPLGNAVSMLDAFNPKDLLNLKTSLDLLSINESTPKKSSRLDSNLDFLKHPARSVLHLPKNYTFRTLARFRYAVAGSKSSRLLHLLI